MYKKPIVFSKSTRTAQEAAESLGCSVAQIAKSLIFIDDTNLPVLVVASGSNRVDEKRFGLQKADADYVKDKTGFVIGGVPPWGHKSKIRTIIDEDLANYEEIWASAGKTNSVFKLTFEELVKETGGEVLAVK
jgi:prolyl-tRNA editing enzyme YbaK/EbsC (Cys-tRNA(Pro) deacylase)